MSHAIPRVRNRKRSLLKSQALEKVDTSIADIQTKVVKEVTFSYCAPAGLHGSSVFILITPYLLTLSIWIQITIHPLSTDGAIVI